jgi:hypothetical protein
VRPSITDMSLDLWLGTQLAAGPATLSARIAASLCWLAGLRPTGCGTAAHELSIAARQRIGLLRMKTSGRIASS